MVAYTKPWLALEQQVIQLASRGVDVGPPEHAAALLQAVGYYRLTGYLYPFRRTEQHDTPDGPRYRILSDYRPGTRIEHAAQLIDFDRRLRMLVMDGVERVEVAVRMQIGYVLGRASPFAHLEPGTFTSAFTTPPTAQDEQDTSVAADEPAESMHAAWVRRVEGRRRDSDEAFVAHFRDKYDDQMPIWALTEILELGHLAVLYRGLDRPPADEIARAFGVPTKRLMTSWLASLNYVRNVAAHHARLYNRKLQNAPGRPKKSAVPFLDHLRQENTPKAIHGLYNALAVIAYLLRSIDPDAGWDRRVLELVTQFPTSTTLTMASMGIPAGWESLELWRPAASEVHP